MMAKAKPSVNQWGKTEDQNKPCQENIKYVSPVHNIQVSYPFPIHGLDHSEQKAVL